MKQTPCECQGPGFCVRHQCVKADWLFHLCRRNMQWFTQWENGNGMCTPVPADFPDCAERESADISANVNGADAGPSLIRRAMNFGAAVARHAADQMRNVAQSSYEARLAICVQCPSCNTQEMVCRERTCGCFLETKARWVSESCPLDKWPYDSEQPMPQPAETIPSQSLDKPG